MRLFDIFRKKPEVGLDVALEDINAWLQVQIASLQKEADAKLAQKTKEIRFACREVKQLVIDLRDAQLSNPSVSSKEKQFMAGNRQQYVRAALQLLDQLEASPSDESLDKFGKATARSYHILQEFFSHEIQVITEKLHHISLLIKESCEISSQSPQQHVQQIMKHATRLLNTIQRKQEFSLAIQRERISLEQQNTQSVKLHQQLKDLDSSDAHKEYAFLLDQLQKDDVAVKSVQAEIRDFFLPLDKPLRKYSRLAEHPKLISAYTTDSVDALMHDQQLEILEVLSNLKTMLSSLQLQKKTEKASQAIDTASRERLRHYQDMLKQAHERHDAAASRLNKNTFEAVRRQFQKTLHELEQQTANSKTELARLEHDLKRIDPLRHKEEIEQTITSLLGKKVTLKLPNI